MEHILTAEETAVMLKFSPRMVRYYLRRGMLPGRKAGRHWLVDEDELIEFLRTGNREAREKWLAEHARKNLGDCDLLRWS